MASTPKTQRKLSPEKERERESGHKHEAGKKHLLYSMLSTNELEVVVPLSFFFSQRDFCFFLLMFLLMTTHLDANKCVAME